MKNIDLTPERVIQLAEIFKPPACPICENGGAYEQLRSDMRGTIERAEANDPAKLKKKIASLEAELRKKPAAAKVETKVERVEIPVLTARQEKLIESISGQVTGLERSMSSVADKIADSVNRLVYEIVIPSPKSEIPANRAPTPSWRPVTSSDASSRNGFTKGPLRVLTAIAQYPDGVEKEQLSVLTGYKRSSRNEYIKQLLAADAVCWHGTLLQATPEGLGALGPDFEPLPTGDALRAYWLERLPQGEKRILTLLLHAYPGSMKAEAIDEAAGYKRSSRNEYVKKLAARRLVTRTRHGIQASETLF